MGFDLGELDNAIAAHGRVARVVIADIKGSCPREIGAAMLVWKGGQSGTIGGGALEYELASRARSATQTKLSSHALGPELGQCCGGAVQILTEVYNATSRPEPNADLIVRATASGSEMPLSVKRVIAQARSKSAQIDPQLCDGWMIEPIAKPNREFWIWGAGHVGRALVHTLAPLPDTSITWIDTSAERFPSELGDKVTVLPAQNPALVVKHAPQNAEHIIVTYSHALDLELCHQMLTHGFAFAGLIGSKSKWARFQSKLGKLGHSASSVSRITCPIGDPHLGKHPQAIAISVGTQLLAGSNAPAQIQRNTA